MSSVLNLCNFGYYHPFNHYLYSWLQLQPPHTQTTTTTHTNNYNHHHRSRPPPHSPNCPSASTVSVLAGGRKNTTSASCSWCNTMCTSGGLVPKVRVQGAKVGTSINTERDAATTCNSNHNHHQPAQDQDGHCNLQWWCFSFHLLAQILYLHSSNLHCVVVV